MFQSKAHSVAVLGAAAAILFLTALSAALGVPIWPYSAASLVALAIFAAYICFVAWLDHWSPIGVRSLDRIIGVRQATMAIAAVVALAVTSTLLALSGYGAGSVACLFLAIAIGMLLVRDRASMDLAGPVLIAGLGKRRSFAFVALAGWFLILIGYILYVSQISFVDTDSTRLLLDARLITEGLAPFKDFVARAPLLIYGLSAIYPYTGADVLSYYMLSALAVWLALPLIYLLCRRFLGRGTSLLAVALYALLPVTANFFYLKTQTFEMLFIIAALYVFARARASTGRLRVALESLSHVGMLFAMLVRPTAALFYVFFMALAISAADSRERIREIGKVALGAVFSVGSFLALTVLYFRSSNLFFYTGGLNLEIGIDSIARFLLTPHYLPLPVIALAASVAFAAVVFRKPRSPIVFASSAMLLALVGAYLCNALLLGFWPQYYMEFALPLAIAAAYGAIALFKDSKGLAVLFAFAVAASFVAGHAYLRGYLGSYHLQSAQEIGREIVGRTDDEAVIFSANPIFPVLSKRDHFMNLTHSYYDSEVADRVIERLHEAKPDIIVGDGFYFETRYLWKSRFNELLSSCYEVEHAVEAAPENRWKPLALYVLKSCGD